MSGENKKFERLLDERGCYIREFSDYRWDLICRIHKQGIAACGSCIGVAAIETGKGHKFLSELDKLKELVLEFNALEEQLEKELAERIA